MRPHGDEPLLIQRIPRGLTDALGLRATGETPYQLERSVRPVFDATELYLQEMHQSNSSLVNGGLTLNFGWNPSGVVVPPGEFWLLLSAGGEVNCQATESCTVTVAFQRSNNPGNYNGTSGLYTQCASNIRTLVGGVLANRQTLLRPGDTVGYWCIAIANQPKASITVDYYRFAF